MPELKPICWSELEDSAREFWRSCFDDEAMVELHVSRNIHKGCEKLGLDYIEINVDELSQEQLALIREGCPAGTSLMIKGSWYVLVGIVFCGIAVLPESAVSLA